MKTVSKSFVWSALIAGSILSSHIVHAQSLKLGMTPEPYMPFTEVNANGEWQGLEADLTRALCDKIEVGCEFNQMAWDGLIPSLTQNKVDFIIGAFSITDERRKVVDFSLPYYIEGTSLVAADFEKDSISLINDPDSDGQIIDAENLKGKIVGVQTSSVQSAYAAKYLTESDIKNYDTADNSAADLAAGRVDYLLAPDLFINDFINSPQGSGFEVKLTVPKNVVLGEGVAYAVRKDDDETLSMIDKALAELQEDGTIQSLVDKWVFEK